MILRIILFIILFILIYRTAKKFFLFFSQGKSEVKGNPPKNVQSFNPEDIEDIDYEEVKRKEDDPE